LIGNIHSNKYNMKHYQGCMENDQLGQVEGNRLYICNVKFIRGITFRNTEYKISNYADDTNFFESDFDSVKKFFYIYVTGGYSSIPA